MNLQDLYNSVAERLDEAGISESRLESQLLIRHAFSFTKPDFYAKLHDNNLTQQGLVRLETTVKQRIQRKPLAYLLGMREFYGREFSVDPSVLIPRQETETLIDHCIEILASVSPHDVLVGDIGTGSGIIAVTLALEIPHLQLVAIDLSPDASAMALHNSRNLGAARSVHCITGDLLTPLKCKFDLIAANLPYIATHGLSQLQPEVSRYEPTLALDGGKEGLDLITQLLNQAQTAIKPSGHIVLEIDPALGPPVARLAQEYFPGSHTTLINDLNGDDRILSIQV